MDYEERNNEAIRFGFNDVEEMELFHDICGFAIIPTFDREELLERCYDDSLGRTKEEFLEYMKINNLIDVYLRVKDLSIFDRFIELYDGCNNEFILTNFMLGRYNKKYEEATKLYDGEMQEEYQDIRKKLYCRLYEIDSKRNNLKNSALYRLEGDEQVKFYNHVEKIDDYMDEINQKSIGRKH